MDWHLVFLVLGGAAGVLKTLTMAARAMPPPLDTCGFWYRWCWNFFQLWADNQDRVGEVQDPKQPVGVSKTQVTVSEQKVS